MSVTAATTRRTFLDPAMDAIALNREQQRLVYDPSPEVDSLLEHVNALAAAAPGPTGTILALLRRFLASNQLEGDSERRIAAAADQLTRDLRRSELNSVAPRPHAAIPAKRLARTLRGPLAAILSPADRDPLAFVAAVRRVDDAIRAVPTVQLLAPTVRRGMRAEQFALLELLVASRNEGDAAGVNGDVAVNGGGPRGQAAV